MRLKLGLVSIVLIILSGCGQQAVLDSGTSIPEVKEIAQIPTQSVPTPTVAASPTPSEIDVTAELSGLPINQFFEEAFDMILARDPELVVEMGLTGFDNGDPALTNVSPDALANNNQLYRDLLVLLSRYDFQALSLADQISYQVFERYLNDEIQTYEDRDFDYLVNPLSVRSQPQLYIMFFTESHPFTSIADAEAYVARLSLLDEKIDQLFLRIEEQAAAGQIPPKIVLENGRRDVKNYLGSHPNDSYLRTAFRKKARLIDGIPQENFDALDEAVVQILKEQVFPAFDRLDGLLVELQSQAPDVIGLSALPDGADFYQRLLEYHTTTDLTSEEIHVLGLSEIERIQEEMRQRFSNLGYPEDETIPELYQRLADDSGVLRGEAITAEYERILREADQLVADYFITHPAGELEVVGGDSGGYYMPGSLDGTRPGRFYARITSPEPIYQMRSLAYHEGIPGHHYQITLASMADLPAFRNFVGFTGYTEGWALYAEFLAYDLGWYADDPYGDLGRLQYEAFRAARLVVDTGIHAMGWDYNQAVDFMVENTGFDPGFMQYEVMRYISYPAQATAYMIGKIEILRMRQEAEEALDEAFDQKEFHSVILENGSMPLDVLEDVVEGWISEKLGG